MSGNAYSSAVMRQPGKTTAEKPEKRGALDAESIP